MMALIVMLIAFFVAGQYVENYLYNKRLLENKINTVITDVDHYYRGGNQYKYNNSYFWASSFNLDTKNEMLQVGDSISKQPNSLVLKVFRKSKDHKYRYQGSYQGTY